jgi:hypothetical protein
MGDITGLSNLEEYYEEVVHNFEKFSYVEGEVVHNFEKFSYVEGESSLLRTCFYLF